MHVRLILESHRSEVDLVAGLVGILVVSLIVVLAATVVSYGIARTVTRPLGTITATMRDLSDATRMTIVIAHRLATVAQADRIYVLEAGSVTEQGTHAELMEGSEAYRKLTPEVIKSVCRCEYIERRAD